MARIDITRFKENLITNCKVHNLVEGEYAVIEVGNQKFFQINTFGSDNRQISGKVSQSIQFDQETLEFIVQIYNKRFAPK